MQPDVRARVLCDESHCAGGDAPPLQRLADPVTEIGAPERSPHDVVEVHPTMDLAVAGFDDEADAAS
jgi:hypothetical protein